MSDLKILYLVDKNTYRTKMSRVRFHGIESLTKLTKVIIWGINWPNYDLSKSLQENIDNNKIECDIVIAYKPLDYKDFSNVKLPKCIRYNEMYDFNWTVQEIEESNADLVICHHENEMKTYKAFYSNYHGQRNTNVQFVHIPHCAKSEVFKDYKLEKKYDILVCGRLGNRNSLGDFHYPLRDRIIKNILPKLPKKYNYHLHKHPGYNHVDSWTDKYLIDMAKEVNASKICITCSGLPKTRFGKYIEIPMCNSVIAGDIPDEDSDNFKNFVIELNMEMSDKQILKKIVHYLDCDRKLNNLKNIGYEWSQKYTQEFYAQKLFETIKNFLQK
tara:strand:+ start:504 stop:1490 length:987 start_codon:yes stop_codon:yes gene_type:complete